MKCKETAAGKLMRLLLLPLLDKQVNFWFRFCQSKKYMVLWVQFVSLLVFISFKTRESRLKLICCSKQNYTLILVISATLGYDSLDCHPHFPRLHETGLGSMQKVQASCQTNVQNFHSKYSNGGFLLLLLSFGCSHSLKVYPSQKSKLHYLWQPSKISSKAAIYFWVQTLLHPNQYM